MTDLQTPVEYSAGGCANRDKLIAGLEALRLSLCPAPDGGSCGCTIGLMPGPYYVGSYADERDTGCPELRSIIKDLRYIAAKGR